MRLRPGGLRRDPPQPNTRAAGRRGPRLPRRLRLSSNSSLRQGQWMRRQNGHFRPRNSTGKVGLHDDVVVERSFREGCSDDPIRLRGSHISCGQNGRKAGCCTSALPPPFSCPSLSIRESALALLPHTHYTNTTQHYTTPHHTAPHHTRLPTPHYIFTNTRTP